MSRLPVLPVGPTYSQAGRLSVVSKHYLFQTVQGEGLYAGMPSTFLRLFGCNDTCSWCDTKHSWQDPHRNAKEVPLRTLALAIADFGLQHVVVTGGEPTLQAEGLVEMFNMLPSNFAPLVTLETNGTTYDRLLADWVGLLSLSPKLHELRAYWQRTRQVIPGVIFDWLMDCAQNKRAVQVKIVVEEEGDFEDAVKFLSALRTAGFIESEQGYIQPEWTRWGTNVKPFLSRLVDSGFRWGPQSHKTWGAL